MPSNDIHSLSSPPPYSSALCLPTTTPAPNTAVIISAFFSFVKYALKAVVLFGYFLKLRDGDLTALLDVLTCGVLWKWKGPNHVAGEDDGQEESNVVGEPDQSGSPAPLPVATEANQQGKQGVKILELVSLNRSAVPQGPPPPPPPPPPPSTPALPAPPSSAKAGGGGGVSTWYTSE